MFGAFEEWFMYRVTFPKREASMVRPAPTLNRYSEVLAKPRCFISLFPMISPQYLPTAARVPPELL